MANLTSTAGGSLILLLIFFQIGPFLFLLHYCDVILLFLPVGEVIPLLKILFFPSGFSPWEASGTFSAPGSAFQVEKFRSEDVLSSDVMVLFTSPHIEAPGRKLC